jgi:hypothetical protein
MNVFLLYIFFIYFVYYMTEINIDIRQQKYINNLYDNLYNFTLF